MGKKKTGTAASKKSNGKTDPAATEETEPAEYDEDDLTDYRGEENGGFGILKCGNCVHFLREDSEEMSCEDRGSEEGDHPCVKIGKGLGLFEPIDLGVASKAFEGIMDVAETGSSTDGTLIYLTDLLKKTKSLIRKREKASEGVDPEVLKWKPKTRIVFNMNGQNFNGVALGHSKDGQVRIRLDDGRKFQVFHFNLTLDDKPAPAAAQEAASA